MFNKRMNRRFSLLKRLAQEDYSVPQFNTSAEDLKLILSKEQSNKIIEQISKCGALCRTNKEELSQFMLNNKSELSQIIEGIFSKYDSLKNELYKYLASAKNSLNLGDHIQMVIINYQMVVELQNIKNKIFEAMKNKPTPIFLVDNFQLNSESEKLNKLISDTISVAKMNKNVK